MPLPALTISVAVLPVFGVTMFGIRRYLAWTSARAAALTSAGAAPLYAAVVCAAVAVVAVLGALPAGAFVAADLAGWRIALAVGLLVPAAVLPYLVELALSGWLAGRRRLPATGLADAHESVAEVSRTPARYAVVAVLTAVAEEILFRGAVLHEIATARGAGLGLLAASLVFGLHHAPFGLPAMVGKTVAGLAWAALALLGGLLVVPVLAHLLFQFLVYRRTVRSRP